MKKEIISMMLFLVLAALLQFGQAQTPICRDYGGFTLTTVALLLDNSEDALLLEPDCVTDPALCESIHNMLYTAEDMIGNIFNGHAVGGCLDCLPSELIDQAFQLSIQATTLEGYGRTNGIGNIYATLRQWEEKICTIPPTQPPPIKISWSLTGRWFVSDVADFSITIEDHPATGGYVINFGGDQVLARITGEHEIYVDKWSATGTVGSFGRSISWNDQEWTRTKPPSSEKVTQGSEPATFSSDYPCDDEDMQGEHNASLMSFSGSERLYLHGSTFCNRKKGWYLKLKGNTVEHYEKSGSTYALMRTSEVVKVKPVANGKTRHILDNGDWLTVY